MCDGKVVQVKSPWELSLDVARHSMEPGPVTGVAGVAAEVVGRLGSGGDVGCGVVPPWYAPEWVSHSREGVCSVCPPSTRVPGSPPPTPSTDNVMGCVRDMVTPVGCVSDLTGELEVHGLPSSGERVVLCGKSDCGVPFDHVSDPGGLYGPPLHDAVSEGVGFRTSACHRTCSGCGITWPYRSLMNGSHMWVCGGCHSLVPYIRSGVGDPGGQCCLLRTLLDGAPVYCGVSCQARHWEEHYSECRRDDQKIAALAAETFDLGYDSDGEDIDVPEYGRTVVDDFGQDTTMPFLMPCSRAQPGLAEGWGHS